jgi:hypothetical protein
MLEKAVSQFSLLHSKHNESADFCSRNAVCFLRCRNIILKYCLGEPISSEDESRGYTFDNISIVWVTVCLYEHFSPCVSELQIIFICMLAIDLLLYRGSFLVVKRPGHDNHLLRLASIFRLSGAVPLILFTDVMSCRGHVYLLYIYVYVYTLRVFCLNCIVYFSICINNCWLWSKILNGWDYSLCTRNTRAYKTKFYIQNQVHVPLQSVPPGLKPPTPHLSWGFLPDVIE